MRRSCSDVTGCDSFTPSHTPSMDTLAAGTPVLPPPPPSVLPVPVNVACLQTAPGA